MTEEAKTDDTAVEETGATRFEQKMAKLTAAVSDNPNVSLDELRGVLPTADGQPNVSDAPKEEVDDSARNEEEEEAAGADETGDEAGAGEGEKGASGEEDEGGEEAGEDDKSGAAPVAIKLPSRNPGGKDIEFEIPVEVLEAAGLDPKEIKHRFGQMRNGYVPKSEYKAFKDRDAELTEVEQALETDPAAFITGRLENDDVKRAVVDAILLDMTDEQRNEVIDAAGGWEDEETRSAAKDRAELARRRAADKKATAAVDDVGDDAVQSAQKLGNAIVDVIPEEWKQARQQRFFREATTELRAYLTQNPDVESIDPAAVSTILEDSGLLDQFSISRSDASDESAGDDADKPKKKKGGKTATERAAARRAATSTPPGAGAAAAAELQLPKGQSVAERIKTLATHFGVKAPKSQ